MVYGRDETQLHRAKMKAARRIYPGEVKPYNLPSNREIRDQIEVLARLHEGERHTKRLWEMRVDALRIMRLLGTFRPRLIGSVLTGPLSIGNVRRGSDIDLHLFSDSVGAVAAVLDSQGVAHEIRRVGFAHQNPNIPTPTDNIQEPKVGVQSTPYESYTHLYIQDHFRFELTVYPANMAHHVPKSSVTGRAMPRASISELEELLSREYPDSPGEHDLMEAVDAPDPFAVYEMLLLPLEHVRENPAYHPEGDALYHSLQVFELARAQRPYDEEFLLAALLHDVGKAIDARDHAAAGLEALDDLITPRTAWLIENHSQAHGLREGSLGVRSRRRLEASEDFDELTLLAECDLQGRAIGVTVPDIEEALAYLRELAETCDG